MPPTCAWLALELGRQKIQRVAIYRIAAGFWSSLKPLRKSFWIWPISHLGKTWVNPYCKGGKAFTNSCHNRLSSSVGSRVRWALSPLLLSDLSRFFCNKTFQPPSPSLLRFFSNLPGSARILLIGLSPWPACWLNSRIFRESSETPKINSAFH